MKLSQVLHPMRRDSDNSDGNSPSVSLLEGKGFVTRLASGIYTQLPMGYRVFNNVKQILNRHLEETGVGLNHFPTLHPRAIWEQSGRLASFQQTMFSFRDSNDRDWCLGPTEEVLAADIASQYIKSYRDMPKIISQTQTKYRNEARPRGGVLRTFEFTMQDAYSFDVDEIEAKVSYDKIVNVYHRALTDMRVPYVMQAQADMGDIGGVASHEFHVLSDAGEDMVEDPLTGEQRSSVEIAHTFQLGEQYTRPMNAKYTDAHGEQRFVFMCSFGMGMERTAAAYVEAMYPRQTDFTWSWALAPFKAVIIADGCSEAVELYSQLSSLGIETLLDDRADVRMGRKIKEAVDMGYPMRVVFGNRFQADGLIEVAVPALKQSFNREPEQAGKFICSLRPAIAAAEIAGMTFQVLDVNLDANEIAVLIETPRQLGTSFCRVADICPDLLGNFDTVNRRTVHGRHLMANEFHIVPHIVKSETDRDFVEIEGVQCRVVDSLERLCQTFSSLGKRSPPFEKCRKTKTV